MAQTGIDFSVYIDERTRDFTGREWVFEALDRWLAEPDAPRYFILTGEPGIGKTAIAARLTQIRDPAAVHSCIARRADTLDPLNFTRSISQQLTRYDGFAQGILEEQGIHVDVRIDIRENYGQVIGVQVENLIVEAPSAAVAFNRAVLDPLKKLYDGGYDRQLTILVDALDEAAQHVGPETIVDLLANVGHLPAQLRFVLTSHLEEAVLRHFEQLSTLHQVLDAGRAENQKDVRDYICLRLEASAALRARLADDGIGHPAFIEQVATASEGNFLYLVWMLRAVADGTQPLAELGTLPQGLDGIYREFLRTRVLGRDIRLWRTYFRPLLGALAAAQSPITAEQLARFSGMERQDVVDGVMDVGQFLEPSSSAEGRYQLYHQSMVDFLGIQERSGEFWIDLPAIHSRIADSYWQSHYPDWQQCDSYGLDSLAAHLFEGGEFGRLHSLIDQGWMATRFQRSGCTYNGFLRDAGLAWRAAGRQNAADRHAGRPLTALALLVRCGLLRASLASLTYHMPPELLAQAVTAGLWPARRALDLVARVPDLAQCARAYSLLLQTGCLDEVQETEARQGLEAARATDGARPGDAPPAAPQTGGDAAQTGREAGVPGSTEALGDALAAVLADPESDFVFPGLSSRTREQLAQALETTLVPSESDLSSRVALRIRLGLPPVDLGTTSDHRREWEYMLAQALALAFDPRLADEFTSTVLHRALAMRFREPRELALRALASYVDGELLQPALEAVLKVEDEECRSEMLGLLAGRLQGELLVRALQAVQSIAGDEWARLEALLALAEHLDGTDREKVLGLGLQLAQGMPLGTPGRACSPRVEALAALAPLLPKAQRKETLEEALAAAKGLSTAPSGPDVPAQALALVALVPQLKGKRRAKATDRALEIAWDTEEYEFVTPVLVALSPYLPDEQLVHGLSIVPFQDDGAKSRLLSELGPPVRSQETLTEALLEATLAIWKEERRVYGLAALAPRLEGAALQRALEATLSLEDEELRAKALRALASQLEGGTLVCALEAALAIQEEQARVKTLSALAPQLGEERQAQILEGALDVALTIEDEAARAAALGALAQDRPAWVQARAGLLYPASEKLLDRAATCSLEAFVERVAQLSPLWMALTGPGTVQEVALALVEVCWEWQWA